MNQTPKCNHCGYEFDSEDTYHRDQVVGTVNTDDGDLSDLNCPKCKKVFHVICEHNFNFLNVDEDGEEL